MNYRMEKDIINFLEENIDKNKDYSNLIERPKISEHGDFSLPVFVFSKELKKNPIDIAKEFEEKLNKSLPNLISKIQAVGPYLNIYLNNSIIVEQILKDIEKGKLLKYEVDNKQKVLVEWPSPNTNKSLHIGHVRNILIGKTLCNLLEKSGNEVIKTNLNNDRGIAICKAMLAYKLYGENKTPESEGIKPDKFVESYYVLFGEKVKENPHLDDEALKMLEDWENGDEDTINLWRKLMSWVYYGYKETYKKFGIKHEKTYYESEIYDKGKNIVLKALKDNVEGFKQEEDGAILCDFENEKFGKKYLLRGNGTTLYMTQDLYLADQKNKDFGADKFVYITGQEQKYHFEVLFELLKRIGFGDYEKYYHFAYGYVYDKDGKKFSSRKGKIIRADELYQEIYNKAKDNIKSKGFVKNSDKDLENKSKIISYAAMAFYILKFNTNSDMNFDIDASVSFEGETGPYVQYTYARISSLLQKGNFEIKKNINYSIFEDKENLLIKELRLFPEIIQDALNKYKLSAIPNYLIKISQMYNEIYQNYNVLKADEEIKNARLYLAYITSKVIKEGLSYLDIQTIENM